MEKRYYHLTHFILIVLMFFWGVFNSFAQTPVSFEKHIIDANFSMYFTRAWDFDGDGDMDILAGNDDLAWFENDGHGNFTKHYVIHTVILWSVYPGDFDQDGDNDMVIAETNSISWCENQGGSWTKHLIQDNYYFAESVAAADFDKDGRTDIASLRWGVDNEPEYNWAGLGRVTWWKNTGYNQFVRYDLDTTFANAHKIGVADVDKDGNMDIVACGGDARSGLTWWQNDGQGNFTKHQIVALGGLGFAVVDIDKNGSNDFVFCQHASGLVRLYLNNGSNSFTDHIIASNLEWPAYAVPGDFNQDGKTDVLIVNQESNTSQDLLWLRNEGNNNFSTQQTNQTAPHTFSADVADFNADGVVDINSGSRMDVNVFWLENKFGQQDSIPPYPITNLEVASVTAISATLAWIAPGDDGSSGQATTYDIRYATVPITDANFSSISSVINPPRPKPANSQESFMVRGLSASTKYYFAIRTGDEMLNFSPLSNVPSATTLPQQQFVDNFERTDLGPNWVTDPEYNIVSGELSNTATVERWDYLAVCTAKTNPIEASFSYGVKSPVPQAQDIENTAMAVMLDAASPNTNGYVVWYRPLIKSIYCYTVENGDAVQEIGHVDLPNLPVAVAGDVFKVIISTNANAHYFDCYINDQYYGTISDPAKLYGNGTDLYAGVMLYGNRHNNIDNFTLVTATANPTKIDKISGDLQSGKVNILLPQPFVVKVTDTNDNPVSDVAVNFTIIQGNGKLDKTELDNNIRIEAENAALTAPMQVGADANASGGHYICTSTLKQGKAEFNFYIATAGTYYIWSRVFAPNDQQDTFFTLMDSQTDTTIWEIVETSADYGKWNWKKVKAQGSGYLSYSLPVGSHKFKILGREPLAQSDKILITNNPSYVPSGLEPVNGYVTDANGNATAYFTLGTIAGSNQVQSTSPILPGQVVNFTATGTVDTPVDLVKISGDGLTGQVGKPLSAPFVVKVTDQYSNPVPNVPVTFTVIEGGGSLSNPQPVITDQNGSATTILTLGDEVATNRVKAVSPGTTPSEIIFTAQATGLPTKIIYASGNNQTGTVGKQLSQPLAVRVTDDGNNGRANYSVTFVITQGAGALVETQPVKTDTNGIARVHWILGNHLDVQKVEARAPSLSGSPITFSAAPIPDNAFTLVKVTGDSGTGIVNQALVQPFVVKVLDQYSNLVPNVDLTFSIIEGGGHFLNLPSPTVVMTNTAGQASVVLELGANAGIWNNRIRVEKTGLTGSPMTFVASAFAAGPAKVLYISGNDQTGFINQTLPLPLVVKITDASDNAVAGFSVRFKVQAGGGTLNGDIKTDTTVTTNPAGLVSVTLKLGANVGIANNVVHAMAINNGSPLINSPIIFEASARYAGSKIVLVSGNNQEGVVGSVLPQPLTVKITTAAGDPVSNQPVTFKVISGGGSLDNSDLTEITKTTNLQGIASVVFKLGTIIRVNNNLVHAIATDGLNPLNGSPVIFIANAISGRAKKIEIVNGDAQTGIVGKPLINMLKVLVTDSLNNGVFGQPVIFKVTRGGGCFSENPGDTVKTVSTNLEGIAEISWILGAKAGTTNNLVRVTSVAGGVLLQGSPLFFNASGQPDVTDPDRSTIQVNSPILADGVTTSPVTIILYDRYLNPIPNKEVMLSMTGSQNYITQPQNMTNSEGKTTGAIASIKAEIKTLSAKNLTDDIQLNSSAQVIFTAGQAEKMSITAGNDQTRNVSTILKDALEVTVTDFYDNPVSNIEVYYEVKSGAGTLIEPQPVITDSNGKARAHYILGNSPGTNSIEARSASLIGSPTLFSAIGVLNAARKLELFSGTNQTGTTREPLANPFIVQVLDDNNNPVKNVEVMFAVVQGEGQISPLQPSISNIYGEASAVLTFGTQTGLYVVEASAAGLISSPVRFDAFANMPGAAKIKMIAGDGQSGTVLTAGSPLRVQVVNRYDEPVANFPVQFSVASDSATITSTQPDSSDANGYAEATFSYGNQAGECIIQAVANQLIGSPIVFHVRALADVAKSVSIYSGNNQHGTVGYPLAEPLKAIVHDKWNNPVANFLVTFLLMQGDAVLMGNSDVLTNLDGIAAMDVQMGQNPSSISIWAFATGLTGSPLDFRAVSVQNTIPTISHQTDKVVSENQNLSFQITGADVDGDPLRFFVYNRPAGAAFDSVNAHTFNFSWTPNYSQQGIHSLIFEVRDINGGFARDTVRVTVVNINRKPIITYFSPSRDTTVVQGQTVQFSILAEDLDQDLIQYIWSKNGVNVATGETYNYVSGPSFSGRDFIIGYATDGMDTASHKWTVDIRVLVELESFTAVPLTEKLGIEISWVTRSEQDNLGFNLYRCLQENGNYVRLNDELVLSRKAGIYNYLDGKVEVGKRYYYKLEAVSVAGVRTLYGAAAAQIELPTNYALEQNYPNPFNPETAIKLQLPRQEQVKLFIFNVLGQKVRSLVDQELPAGYHIFKWDGKDDNDNPVTSGIYYYRLQTGTYSTLKKMVFLK